MTGHPQHWPPAPVDATGDRAAGDLADGLVTHVGGRIAAAMGSVLLGKPNIIRLTLVALITEGHLLIEDVPGTGKTSLAKALARCVDGTVSRIQFTPDLMPGDVTGVTVFRRESGDFTFRPGPIFATIVVADEINRASPKTQSALLEAMEERQVTADGTAHPLPRPFLVLATQNPVDMEGTYPLPEAQRDRFFARTAIGYPDVASEIAMLADHDRHDPMDLLRPVTDTQTVARMVAAAGQVHLAPALREYIVTLVAGTRSLPEVRLGASPRAVIHLGRAAKAAAALDGRDYVIPDDITHLAVPVLAHRLLLTIDAGATGTTGAALIARLLRSTRVPLGARGPH